MTRPETERQTPAPQRLTLEERQRERDSRRWVRLFVPEAWEQHLWGCDPVVIHEAPKGAGLEVRMADAAETGRLARLALPPTTHTKGKEG